MYDLESKDGITLFQMKMDYYLRQDGLPLLRKMYGDVKIIWGEYSVRIDTFDGLYKGVVINVHPSNYEVYKNERKFGSDRIYQWFNGGIKAIRGDRFCDDLQEYNLLMSRVIQPIQEIVEGLEKRDETRKYIGKREVEEETGISYLEHDKLVRAVKRFAEGLNTIEGVDVRYGEYGYYTWEHFGRKETIWLVIITEEFSVMMVYSLPGNIINFSTDSEDINLRRGVLQEVAWNVLKTKGFTKFDRGRLVNGKDNLFG